MEDYMLKYLKNIVIMAVTGNKTIDVTVEILTEEGGR